MSDFKTWYYQTQAKEMLGENPSADTIVKCINEWEISQLDDFVDDYHMNEDYTEHQKRFFNCETFCNALMGEDELRIFKYDEHLDTYEEITEITRDHIGMELIYNKNDTRTYQCDTDGKFFIIKDNYMY
jgi:RNase H-fold protein (predicted Holliday junction resolvase)